MKLTVKRPNGEVLAQIDDATRKINIEFEEEIGDDITKIIVIKGLYFTDERLRAFSDCRYERFRNERKKK